MAKSIYPPVFDEFPPYRGGRTLVYNGYVWEFHPGHRLQNLWGFVPQHRMIAEDTIGRPLQKGEVVHHVDSQRTNNDPANLQVMSQKAHRQHHARLRGLASRIPLSEEEVIQALEKTGGIKPAARSLGISHSTLRNRFPDACIPYRRVSPVKIDNPRDLDKILRAAGDPNIGLRELAADLHISAMSISRICKRNGVKWVRKSKKGEVHRTYQGKPTRKMSKGRD